LASTARPPGRAARPLCPAGPGGVATHAEPEGHVVDGVHVGKERVALEDHAHVALLGRSACQVLAVDEHVTGVEGLEASEHPKSRRLPATRGAEERHQLARSDVEAEAVERLGGPEGAAKARQTHRRTRPLGRQWSPPIGLRPVPEHLHLDSFRSHRRDWRRSNDVISSKSSQVPTNASSDTAVETWASSCSKLTIQTGKVWYWSRLAIVNSPSTRATVRMVAERSAARRFGSTTRKSVLDQRPPSERDASTRVLRSMPAARRRATGRRTAWRAPRKQGRAGRGCLQHGRCHLQDTDDEDDRRDDDRQDRDAVE